MISFQEGSPLLVFGGPYSNLPATRAMRTEAARLGVPAANIICTGDVVAYCAEAEETTALVRDWGIHTIAGNCEEQLAVGSEDCACGFEEGSACDLLAKGWYPYANARISDSSRTWMKHLPSTLEFRYAGARFKVIHGGTSQTNRFLFASQTALMREELARTDADVVIGGHSGLPFIARIGAKVWFNPGVIGMPANDGTSDVWFGLVTMDASCEPRFELRRLAYDHRAAAAALRRSGHANDYARTLVTGVWPSLDILPAEERAMTGKRLRPRSLTLRSGSGRRQSCDATPNSAG